MSPEKRRIATWAKRRSAPNWWVHVPASNADAHAHTHAV
jgi:hypothetical protein